MAGEIGRPVINRHGVPNKVWGKWSRDRQHLFNTIMHEMRPSRQTLLIPLCTPTMKRSEWDLFRHSVADVLSEVIQKRRA